MKKKDLQEIRLADQGDNEWEFEFPRIGIDADEELDLGVDLMDSRPGEAAKIFSGLTRRYPEFIDAWHHLALISYRSSPDRWCDARVIWERLSGILLAVAPSQFQIGRDKLLWDMVDNRPYLRVLHSLACLNMDEGKYAAAQQQLEELLLLDPDDSLGCRGMLPACYLERRRAPAVLELEKRYPDDLLPDFVWSVILARYQLGMQDEARALLKIAAKHQRNILRIIQRGKKPTVRRGQDDDDRHYAMGSVAEAADFWLRNSRYWLGTPGAVEFIQAFGEGDPAPAAPRRTGVIN